MLKWTINRRVDTLANTGFCEPGAIRKRRSCGNLLDDRPRRQQPYDATAASGSNGRQHRRRSLANELSAECPRRYRQRNKENMVPASPHPLLGRGAGVERNTVATSTPLSNQAAAFRDVANTTPTRLSLTATLTPVRKRNLPPSPLLMAQETANVLVADSNRAVGISVGPQIPQIPHIRPASTVHAAAGSFIGHARYFAGAPQITAQEPTTTATSTSTSLTPLSRRMAELRFSKISIQRHRVFSDQCDDEDDANMSSKALDNTALDHMIDEILYSTRKPKLIPASRLPLMKPQGNQTRAAELPKTNASPVADTEMGSPISEVCHLRRQGGLRRKRTCRTFEAGQQHQQINALMSSHPFLRQSIEILASLETPPKKMRWA